tara:strand:- start:946 stop:1536 length:591 start_codon:yes stop_codon:yes gene_type:complete
MLKRVNRELEIYKTKRIEQYPNSLKNFFNNTTIQLYITNYDNEDQHFFEIKVNDIFFLTLKIPKYYPFEPYSVHNNYYINNYQRISYHKYINNICSYSKRCNYEILDFFYKILYGKENKHLKNKKNTCYCCESLTCKSNWNPALTVNDVIIEYLEIKFIEKYSTKTKYELLENLYVNLFLQLPDDIKNLILFYCYN